MLDIFARIGISYDFLRRSLTDVTRDHALSLLATYWTENRTRIVAVVVAKCDTLHVCVCVCRDRITLAVLELRENEDLAKLERTWWIDKGQCGSGSTFMKVTVPHHSPHLI